MRIIGFNFDKILIERKKEIQAKLDIKTNLNVSDISKESMELVKENVLRFNFNFEVLYEPDFADIKFSGKILAVMPLEKAKEVFKHWKKKKIMESVRIPLFNFILTKCNIKALELEEEFNLPLHVPMPKLMPEEAGQQNQQASPKKTADYVR